MSPVQPVVAQPVELAREIPFSEYGFEVSGFTHDQEQIIRRTLEMYAQALGGPEKLREIMTTYSRDWQKIKDPNAPMEEAVTNLSLKVDQMGYYFSNNKNRPESNPQIAAEIEAWTEVFLLALRQLD